MYQRRHSIILVLFCFILVLLAPPLSFFFFFNDTATTEIYTLSLHDSLPISLLIRRGSEPLLGQWSIPGGTLELGETLLEGVAREMLEETGITVRVLNLIEVFRSEEHTSELQSRSDLVCRLLLEKKKKQPRHSVIINNRMPSFDCNKTHCPHKQDQILND